MEISRIYDSSLRREAATEARVRHQDGTSNVWVKVTPDSRGIGQDETHDDIVMGIPGDSVKGIPDVIKKGTSDDRGLSNNEEMEIAEMKRGDRAVRAHEAAHLAAGSGLTRGGASYTYTRGPDGKIYATGGEVKIDISEVNGNPQATIQKMQRVQAAALAPVDPSAQDRAVASRASAISSKARIELNEENMSEMEKAYKMNKAIDSFNARSVDSLI